jgi:hypothetical protein
VAEGRVKDLEVGELKRDGLQNSGSRCVLMLHLNTEPMSMIKINFVHFLDMATTGLICKRSYSQAEDFLALMKSILFVSL